MLCGGDREKGDVAMEEKWDYVVGLHGDIDVWVAGILIITHSELGRL